MKRKIVIITVSVLAVALIVASGLIAGFNTGKINCGGTAEKDITVYTDGGKRVTLSSKHGKPVVVNFWASWCSYCVQEMPDFQDMYEKYGDEVEFMMVNVKDTKANAKEIISRYGFTFPVYYDRNDVAYGAYVTGGGIPVTAFINKDGTIEYVQKGMISESKLETYIQKINK